jgi:hypothetical protein
MGHDETAPLVVDGLAIGQERHHFFDHPDFPVHVLSRQAKAVPLHRARGDVPKFGDVLVRVVENAVAPASLARAASTKA